MLFRYTEKPPENAIFTPAALRVSAVTTAPGYGNQFVSVSLDLTESWWITPIVRQTERVPEHGWFVARPNMP